MYTEIGQVSQVTIGELRDMLEDMTWETHTSEVTNHQAAKCTEPMKLVGGICALWPADTWSSLTFLRLPPAGKLYLKIAERSANMEEPTVEDVDLTDPAQADIWKTVEVLLNKVIYADSYLQQ